MYRRNVSLWVPSPGQSSLKMGHMFSSSGLSACEIWQPTVSVFFTFRILKQHETADKKYSQGHCEIDYQSRFFPMETGKHSVLFAVYWDT